MMEYINNIILALSAVAIAIFAWLGLRIWRRELIGRARFETARSMMRLGFKLRQNFEGVRNPLTMSTEWADRIPQTGETDAESEVLNAWYAKAKLLNLVIDSLNKVIEVEWEAEILLEEYSVQSVKEAVQMYRESYADLSSAILTYFEIRQNTAKTGDQYEDQQFLRELRKTIYSASNDAFSKKVNDATDKLSSALKQYVK